MNTYVTNCYVRFLEDHHLDVVWSDYGTHNQLTIAFPRQDEKNIADDPRVLFALPANTQYVSKPSFVQKKALATLPELGAPEQGTIDFLL